MTTCTKCGQSIKNVFEYQGNPYGMDCVLTVSGLRSWELKTAKGDIEGYKKQVAEKIAKNQKDQNELEMTISKNRSENAWILTFLESLNSSSFVTDITRIIERKGVDGLTDNQYFAIANIYTSNLKGMSKTVAEIEFEFATGNMEATTENMNFVKIEIAQQATLKELKDILKENGIKGITKMDRSELENEVVKYINL